MPAQAARDALATRPKSLQPLAPNGRRVTTGCFVVGAPRGHSAYSQLEKYQLLEKNPLFRPLRFALESSKVAAMMTDHHVTCLLSGSLFLVAGCGHQATREECEQIFHKITALELTAQGLTDPALVAQKKAEMPAEKQEELLQRCIGRRITNKATACMGAATTYDEIENSCLR